MLGSIVFGTQISPATICAESAESENGSMAERNGPQEFNILIIEDNPGDVFVMKEAIREHCESCVITVLSDGEQASLFLDRIDDSAADCPLVILLDLNLPKRSGHWVLARVRNSPRCGSVPIIIVSSSAANSDLVATRSLGANAYFQKPSSLEEFMKLGGVVQSLL